MYVIGTAGHVDHGKTLLIKAMCGIDTDRLPEEKERGLTIDLGFAHFIDTRGEPIGIVDVPGHERFIRNMVAGAWALDLALLVVAADDGWMEQSEDHTRVLVGMGVDSVILAITKIDSTGEEQIRMAEEEACDRFMRLAGYRPQVVRVSSVTGEGVDRLKKLIEETLLSKEKREFFSSPFLYIDRVFTLPGAGTIVTGTLKGGKLTTNDEVTVLPSGLKCRIRSIQSYHSFYTTASPVSRVALNLQGIKREELSRGDCVVKNPEDFWIVGEVILKLDDGGEGLPSIKNHGELEIAYGTDHQKGRIHLLKEARYARICFSKTTSIHWGQRCVLIRHGGSKILGAGRCLWPGKTSPSERRDIIKVLQKYSGADFITSFDTFRFMVRGFGLASELEQHDLSRLEEEAIPRGKWIFLRSALKRMESSILSSAERPGGVSIGELSQATGVKNDILKAIIAHLLEKGKLNRRGELLFSIKKERGKANLGKKEGEILRIAGEAGRKGIELKKLSLSGVREQIRILVREGFLVPLDGNIYYTKEVYDEVVSDLLKGFKKGGRFSIPTAKEKTGLSRKYIIPILNRMESQGLVKRLGDEREVL
ncbi:MAG: selenocysteine-specific translation elongation factor [Spirochaetes bacterium]|nr:MAG: selenocysteine-specific translation elongation factor [Spirochaetota bacterium]